MKQWIVEKLKDVDRSSLLTSEELAAVVRIESAMYDGFRNYCRKENFREITVPHLTNSTGACENFSTLFSVEYFGRTAYLSQTGQLYLEAFIPKFKRVYCISPSFRKESEVDSRHLVEFPLLEIEAAEWDLKELTRNIEKVFDSMILSVLGDCKDELKFLGVEEEWLLNMRPPYKSITYEKAIQSLESFNLKWGDDLKSLHEHELVKKNDNKPVFITHYPQEIKFFNMRLNRESHRVVNSADLLLPYGGEAVGAAEREENREMLEKRLRASKMLELMCQSMRQENNGYEKMTEENLREEAVKRFLWYLNLIDANGIKHAGCGIGFNRVTQSILKCPDIRAATSYPLNREILM